MPDHELKEWSALSRSITEEDRVRHTPPPGLFDKIAAELATDGPALSVVSDDDETVPVEEPVIDLTQERERRAPAAQRKQRRQLFVASLAAACALVIGFSVIGGDDSDTITLVAEATNADLPEAFGGAATAIVSGDDQLTLELELSRELPTEEPVELWLIKPDLSDMVSLGIVEPGATEWQVPATIDPTEYSLVDLSIEPDDGNEAHSGRSILRGALEERDI